MTSLTNAEARKLAETHVAERRNTQRSLTWHETADLAHWVLSRLGQEDVMDAATDEEIERRAQMLWEASQQHYRENAESNPRGKFPEQSWTEAGEWSRDYCRQIVRAMSAVTPAVTRETLLAALIAAKATELDTCDEIADAVLSLYRAV